MSDSSSSEWQTPTRTISRRYLNKAVVDVDPKDKVMVFWDMDTTKIPNIEFGILKSQLVTALRRCNPKLHIKDHIRCYGLQDDKDNKARLKVLGRDEFRIRLSPRRNVHCKGCKEHPDYVRPVKKALAELEMVKDIYCCAMQNRGAHILVISGDRAFGRLNNHLKRRGFNMYAAICDDSRQTAFLHKETTWLWSTMVKGGQPLKPAQQAA